MVRVAAVDLGTNSIRLLISDVSGDKPRDVLREMMIVRLGEGVDKTGQFQPEALERTRHALEHYVDTMVKAGVKDVRMVATSATRDAGNREEFFEMTAELLGRVKPGAVAEVISGEEEASLSFAGAVSDLHAEEGPFCVIDLGGGSTEFIVGTGVDNIFGAYSAQMGCVRITERLFHHDPPTVEETTAARELIWERLDEVLDHVPVQDAKTIVGCAGTFTTLSALAQGLEQYDPVAIHDSVLDFPALRALTAVLQQQTGAERALNPVIHPGRADVLGAGSMIVDGIMDTVEEVSGITSFVISEKDILDGIVASLAPAHR